MDASSSQMGIRKETEQKGVEVDETYPNFISYDQRKDIVF